MNKVLEKLGESIDRFNADGEIIESVLLVIVGAENSVVATHKFCEEPNGFALLAATATWVQEREQAIGFTRSGRLHEEAK